MLGYQAEIFRFMANDILEEFSRKYTGEKYERTEKGRYHRHGYNRSTIRLGNDRIGVEVPRIMDTESEKSFNVPEYSDIKNANTSFTAFRSPLAPSITTSSPSSYLRPLSMSSQNSWLIAVAFSVTV